MPAASLIVRLTVRLLAGPIALLGVAGCGRERADAATNDTVHVPLEVVATGESRMVGRLDGLHAPESALYDPDQDVWFISNMFGYGSVKDGNGYIVRANAADMSGATMLVQGGRNGASLDAPKGMTLHGDTLWVTDIDVLRGFHRRTGATLAAIDFRPHGAVLLNDVTVGGDGRLYVTDSGIRMTEIGVIYSGGEKIFAVGPGRAIGVVAEGSSLGHPNGITWDSAGRRLVVVSFHPFDSRAYAFGPADTTRTTLATGPGRFDGVEALPDGRILFTAWTDSSVHLVGAGSDTRIVRNLWQPADLGLDRRRMRVAVPVVVRDRVELWALPTRPRIR